MFKPRMTAHIPKLAILVIGIIAAGLLSPSATSSHFQQQDPPAACATVDTARTHIFMKPKLTTGSEVTTHVALREEGRVFLQHTDATGTVQLIDIDTRTLADGFLEVSPDNPIGPVYQVEKSRAVLGSDAVEMWTIRMFDHYRDGGTKPTERWLCTAPATSSPQWLVGSAVSLGSATVPTRLSAGTQPAVVYATHRITAKVMADRFVGEFNPAWAHMMSRDLMSESTGNSCPTCEAAAKARLDETDEWGRAWVGLVAMAAWHYNLGSAII